MFLYKSRMSDQNHLLRDAFFDSLDDAAQLLRLFDFVPNVYLYVKDLRGRFVGMNRQWVAMRGASAAEELIGKTDLELHPAFWARQYQEEDRRVIESGRELPEQVWLVPAGNGKLGSFVSTKIPLRDSVGEVIGIAGVMYRNDIDSAARPPSDPVKRATEMIANRYDGPLEIAQLASEVGLSVSQLNRRFRASYRIPPSEYLQRVRVNEASRRLAQTDHSIIDVALATGFFDQAHLTRTFKRWTGMTPREFRNVAKND